MAIDLVKSKASVGARDCFGATPLHVAACHNHLEMVYLLFKYGSDINGKTLNGSTPLHSAAACGAVGIIDRLLYHRANLSAVDNSGLTALHYAVLNINSSQLHRKVLLNTTDPGEQCQLVTIDRTGHLAKFFTDENYIKNTDHYRWLDTLIHLIRRGSEVDAVDMYGRTALYIAAANGLADAINVLLQNKAKFEIADKFGKEPLEVAVENATAVPEHRRKQSAFILGRSLDGLQEALSDHEMVVFLLLTYGASVKKCKRTKRTGQSLLHHAVTNNQPYIAQLLLLKGASLTCKDNLGRTPLVAYLHNGGYLSDIVLEHFNASVTIQCGKPFNLSMFHLLCYRSPSLEALNFFERRELNDQNQKCLSPKSSFVTAIENHRLKYKVIDACLDAEGFTPLHRAAQGANIVAVRNLIKHGANISLLSPQGHDALTLAILHAGGNVWGNLKLIERPLTKDNVSDVATELLRHKMKTSKFQIVCDSSKSKLTLYHLAASRGLVKFIKQIFKDKNLHKLDVNCPNRDGITPMYLAKIFSNLVESDIKNPWEEVVRFIKNQGVQMQYPRRGAEYNAVYNRLYGWIPNEFKLNLRPDIRGFIFRLLSMYEFWQINSKRCQTSIMNKTTMGIGSPLSTKNLYMELIQQSELLNSQRSFPKMAFFVLRDLKLCHRIFRRGSRFFEKYGSYLRFSHALKARKVNLNNVQESLYYLMRMWHENVFGDFACLKRLFHTYRPYFADERKSRLLIDQYEGSTPVWYLNQICIKFSQAFTFDVLHYVTDATYREFTSLYYKYPIFITERMGWTVNQLRHAEPWPLEFLVKFSLGFYPQYDYLKVLNVGLGPRTYISLYSDKMKQVREELKQKSPRYLPT